MGGWLVCLFVSYVLVWRGLFLLCTSLARFRLPIPYEAWDVFGAFCDFPARFFVYVVQIDPCFFSVANATSCGLVIRLRANDFFGDVCWLRCERTAAYAGVRCFCFLLLFLLGGTFGDGCIYLNGICGVSGIASAEAIEDVVVIAGCAGLFASASYYLDRVEGRILEGSIEGFARRHDEVHACQVRVARRSDISQDAKDCYVAGSFFICLFHISVEEFDFLSEDLFYCKGLVKLAVGDTEEQGCGAACVILERRFGRVSWEGGVVTMMGR